MKTRLIEVTNGEFNWGKFLLGKFDDVEWAHPSKIDHRPLIQSRGWSRDGHIFVLDLQTGEGAIFQPGGLASADLAKHKIWVCPLYEPFLTWLYAQPEPFNIPDHVDLPNAPPAFAGYRRPGPSTTPWRAPISPEHISVPLRAHPGAFGVTRKHHIHEGVDLYCPEGTPVSAVEDGLVVAVIPFTGERAASPWWLDTDAALVEGLTGVVVYGEITAHVATGQLLQAGERVGSVKRVLKHDKGRPLSMLHLELHKHGTRDAPEWSIAGPRPSTLLDPTSFLLEVT